MKNRIVVVIPARFASSRLPGKPLLDLGGKPMIRHVYERASLAQVDAVLVATDDARIFAAVQAFGGQVVMSEKNHSSGTDRVAEAALALNADIVVNVQGDEPLLDPTLIDLVSTPLTEDATLVMATVAHPISATGSVATVDQEVLNPNLVKVVCDRQGFALYFSRLPIPFDREHNIEQNVCNKLPNTFLRHIGLYAYRADFLQTFTHLPITELEQREQLEQLRALEHGYRIRVVVTHDTVAGGVDTPTDLQRVRRLLATNNAIPATKTTTETQPTPVLTDRTAIHPVDCQRISTRLSANSRGIAQVDGKSWVVEILNMGLKGFGIISDHSLQVGSTVLVKTTEGVSLGVAVCEVVFCHERHVSVAETVAKKPTDMPQVPAIPQKNVRRFHIGLSMLEQKEEGLVYQSSHTQ